MFEVIRKKSNYHQVNEQNGIETGKKFEQPSLTVPDRVMTLRDLIERHTRGMHVPIKDAHYEQERLEADWPDVSTMNKTQLMEFSNELKTYIDGSRQAIQEFNQKRRDKEAQDPSKGSGQANEAEASVGEST